MGQQVAFANACAQLGLRVAHLPCLTIRPLPNEQLRAELLQQTDSVLFTSKNAVMHAHRICPLPWPGTNVNAIGPATMQALASLAQAVQLTPKPPYTSESFLQQLAGLPPQKLWIIKGYGGRTLIADHLSKLGWCIKEVDVYERSLPDISTTVASTLIQSYPPDLISITSNETLQNLKLLVPDHWDSLCLLPLIVNSERSATLAETMGFKLPAMVAHSAGDEGQFEQVKHWLADRIRLQ